MANTLAYCGKCGWCHFEVTAEYVQKWADEWAQYCKEWDEERLAAYGIKDRKPPAGRYETCFRCEASYRDFVDVGDCPRGSTIQAILRRQDTLPASDVTKLT